MMCVSSSKLNGSNSRWSTLCRNGEVDNQRRPISGMRTTIYSHTFFLSLIYPSTRILGKDTLSSPTPSKL